MVCRRCASEGPWRAVLQKALGAGGMGPWAAAGRGVEAARRPDPVAGGGATA